ncbi:MAG: flagellar FlbD family protein [Solirubrobacteraceae bacterium]|nr:flagellar FlbD family protein [Patulibacter sp.]
MITLHRLGKPDAEVLLNCDLVLTIETIPDTVITLVTGARLLVSESADEVVERIREWRIDVARHTFGTPKLVEPTPYDFDPSR